VVRFTTAAQEMNAALKQFLRTNVYYTEPLVAERTRSAREVAELFTFFVENPGELPGNYRDGEVPVHRAVCDYIAGMTDGFFGRVYTSKVGQASEPRVT
jgi:dGTPase